MNNDLISREALKKALKSNCDVCNDKNTNWCEHCCSLNDFEDLIDNAPAVEDDGIQELIKENFNIGYEMAKNKYAIPQGEWIYEGMYKRCNCCNCLCFHTIEEKIEGYLNFCPNCGADMRKDEEDG